MKKVKFDNFEKCSAKNKIIAEDFTKCLIILCNEYLIEDYLKKYKNIFGKYYENVEKFMYGKDVFEMMEKGANPY